MGQDRAGESLRLVGDDGARRARSAHRPYRLARAGAQGREIGEPACVDAGHRGVPAAQGLLVEDDPVRCERPLVCYPLLARSVFSSGFVTAKNSPDGRMNLLPPASKTQQLLTSSVGLGDRSGVIRTTSPGTNS